MSRFHGKMFAIVAGSRLNLRAARGADRILAAASSSLQVTIHQVSEHINYLFSLLVRRRFRACLHFVAMIDSLPRAHVSAVTKIPPVQEWWLCHTRMYNYKFLRQDIVCCFTPCWLVVTGVMLGFAWLLLIDVTNPDV